MTITAAPRTTIGRTSAHLVVARQVRDVLEEARPVVQVVFLMRLVAATGLLARFAERDVALVGGWLLIVIAIYVFNGVTDLQADAANGSTRPIASGRLARATALRWCVLAACCGLAVCWLVGPAVFALGAVMLLIGWAYSDGPALKETALGFAAIVGLGAALTYLAGWLAHGTSSAHSLEPMLAIALWVGVCCASKDFSDIDGDRLAGRHTWPVILGPRRAACLLATVALAASGATLAGSVSLGVSPAPAAVLVVGSALLAVVAVSSATGADRQVRRRPYRAFMATQYAANLALICAGFA